MLEHTFCHIPGIGAKTERRLWEAGLDCWGAVRAGDLPVTPRRGERLRRGCEESEGHLADGKASLWS